MFVTDLLAPPAPVIVTTKLKDIWHQVVTLESKILHNDINHWVRNFNAWNGDVMEALKEARQYDTAKIFQEIFLEDDLALRISPKICEELLHALAEALVPWILIKLLSDKLELSNNTVGIVPVPVSEEEVALIVQAVPFLVRLLLQNEALFLETATGIVCQSLFYYS